MSSSAANVGEQQQQKTFKEQLDQKAKEARQGPEAGKEVAPPTLLEKVTEAIPAAAKFLGTAGGGQKKNDEETTAPKEELAGLPNRPDHDPHIEDFVREQHKSKKGKDGQLAES